MDCISPVLPWWVQPLKFLWIFFQWISLGTKQKWHICTAINILMFWCTQYSMATALCLSSRNYIFRNKMLLLLLLLLVLLLLLLLLYTATDYHTSPGIKFVLTFFFLQDLRHWGWVFKRMNLKYIAAVCLSCGQGDTSSQLWINYQYTIVVLSLYVKSSCSWQNVTAFQCSEV